MKKHVAIITGVFPPMPSGIADYSEVLAVYLRKAGWQVSVITSKASKSVPEGVKCFPVMQTWDFDEKKLLLETIKQISPSAILIEHGGDIYHENKLIEFLPYFLGKSIPVVTAIHDRIRRSAIPFFKRSLKSLILGIARFFRVIDENYFWLLKRSRSVIFSNIEDADFYKANYKSVIGKSRIIPIGANILPVLSNSEGRKSGRKKFGIDSNVSVIGFHGFLLRNKGIENLLSAFSSVAKDHSDVVLLIAGGESSKEYLHEIRNFIEGYGLSHRVIFTGHLGREEASKAIHCCDIMVLPFEDGVSFKRGSFINCVAHGIPVITTKGDFVAPELKHGENVWLVPKGDTEKLSEGIKEILSNSDMRLRLAKGTAGLAEYFDWDKIAASIGRELE